MVIVIKGLIKTPAGLVKPEDLKAGDKVITRGGEAVAVESVEAVEATSVLIFKQRPSVVLGADAVLATAMGDRTARDGKGAAVYMLLPNWLTMVDEIQVEERSASGWAICGSEKGQTLFVNDYCVRC